MHKMTVVTMVEEMMVEETNHLNQMKVMMKNHQRKK
jgi:hypothetical protein